VKRVAGHYRPNIGGAPAVMVGRDPTEIAALRAAVDALLARAHPHCQSLVARAAEALDDLREELARADGLIAEQQERIGGLYELFGGREGEGA
jgi:hypothetical protein